MSVFMDGHEVKISALPEDAGGTMDAWGHADMRQAYLCEWDARFDVLAYLLGYPPGPSYLGTPREPHRYPGLPALVALQAVWSGKGGAIIADNADAVKYPQALIVARYGVPNYRMGPGDSDQGYDQLPFYAEEHIESGTDVWSAGKGTYRWEDGGGLIEQRVGIKTPWKLRVWTLHRVTSINWVNIDLAQGTINHSYWNGYPAEYLLFESISTKRNIGPAFQPYQVVLKFREVDHSWNKMLRGNVYKYVLPRPYELTDFNQIFTYIV